MSTKLTATNGEGMKNIIKLITISLVLCSFGTRIYGQSCSVNIPLAVYPCSGNILTVTKSGSVTFLGANLPYTIDSQTGNMRVNVSGLAVGQQHGILIDYQCGWDFLSKSGNFWVGAPTINTQANISTHCSGNSLSVQLAASPAPPGLKYAWTSSVTSGSVSGNGSGENTYGAITETLTGSGIVTYTIYTKLYSCEGTHKTFTVTVNPTSGVGSGVSGPSTACAGSTVTLTAMGTPYGGFHWERRERPVGNVQPELPWIPDAAYNTNPRNVSIPHGMQSMEYRIVTDNQGMCASPKESGSLLIDNIQPQITLSVSAYSGASTHQTPICTGGNIYANVTVTNGAGVDWTASSSSGNVSGYSGGGRFNSGLVTLGTGVSVANEFDGVIQYNFSANKNGCSVTISTQTVTVPSLYLTGSPVSPVTICSGTGAGVSLTKATSGSVSYSGTVLSGTVTGALTGSTTNINDVLTNTGVSQAIVRYTITLTNAGCSKVETFDVYVQPITDPGELFVNKTSVCGVGNVILSVEDNTHPVKIQYSNASTSGVFNDIVGTSIFQITQDTDFRTTLVTPLCGAAPSSVVKTVLYYPDPKPGLPEDKAYHQASGSFNLELNRVAGFGYEVYDPQEILVFDTAPGQTANIISVNPVTSTRYRVFSKTHDTCISTGFATLDANYFGDDVPVNNPVVASANYIKSFNANVEGLDETDLYTGPYQMSISLNYLDGLGREIQSIQREASPNATDLIVPIEYDQFGRQVRNYLPYSSNNSAGEFDVNSYYNQHQYYQSPALGVAGDLYSFGQTGYEKSPLNRVVETAAPGFAWYPGFDFNYTGRKTSKTNYHTNTVSIDGEIRIWSTDGNGNLYLAGNYSSNQLYVTTIIDENGYEVREYKDKQGKTILKRVQATEDQSQWAETYYVYDSRDNLTVVLPPEAVASAITQLSQN